MRSQDWTDSISAVAEAGDGARIGRRDHLEKAKSILTT